jgi:hypothetical protein
VALALTRVVAEGGLMFVHTGWMTLWPLAFLFGGTGGMMNAASAAPASMICGQPHVLDARLLLPSFVQSFKLAHDRKSHEAAAGTYRGRGHHVVRHGCVDGNHPGLQRGRCLQLQRWWIDNGATQPADAMRWASRPASRRITWRTGRGSAWACC